MTEQELADMHSAAVRNVDNLQLTGEQWGAFDPTSILKLLDYVGQLKAENTSAVAALHQVAAATQSYLVPNVASAECAMLEVITATTRGL